LLIGIVDCVGPRICDLRLKAMRKALLQLQSQAVLPVLAAILHLENRAVRFMHSVWQGVDG
jgi:hypothetical protein